jgi:hypothetical protein
LGYHNKGYPNQSNQKSRKNILTTIIRVRAPVHPTRPTPQGLGRKFRLARPLRASDASSDSPDPSGPRTPVPTRPTSQGLGRKLRFAQSRPRLGRRTPLHLGNKTSPDMTDATAPITRQGKAMTVSTTPVTVALPLSLYTLTPVHCSTLPHSRKGMGEVNQHHCLWSFPTVDRICSSAGDPTPATPTGFGNPLQE